MMNYLTKLFVVSSLVVIGFLTACSFLLYGSDESEFNKLLIDPSVQDINQSIRIKLDPANAGKPESRGIINLIIYNKSSKYILFSPSSEVQVFKFSHDENKWEEITNKVNYHGEDMLVDPKGTGLDISPIPIRPDYDSNGKEQKLRVAVTGYLVEEGQVTDEPVSAYVDFNVNP